MNMFNEMMIEVHALNILTDESNQLQTNID